MPVTSVAPAIRSDRYALMVSPYAPEMFPQPTTATQRLLRHGVLPACGELLANLREHARALGCRVAVERVVLDAHRARVADREKPVDAAADVRAALSVHTADVRVGASTSFRCTWKSRPESSSIAATGSYS